MSEALTEVEREALRFVREFEPVSARALFENGPAPSVGRARTILRRLRALGLVDIATTACGRAVGHYTTDKGDKEARA